MNELPRQKLCEVIRKYGESLCDEPLRLEGLLRDLCGKYRLEINLIVHALKEGVATDLRTSSESSHPELLIGRLIKRLRDHLAMSEEAARWVVESWALALGKIDAALSMKTPAPAAKPRQQPVRQTADRPTPRRAEPARQTFHQPAYEAPDALPTYPQPKRSKAWLYIIVFFFIACLGGGAAWYFKLLPPLATLTGNKVAETPAPAPSASVEPETSAAPVAQATPKLVRPLPPEAKTPFDKGSTAVLANEWVLAAKYFEEARKIVPYSPEILFNLADAESKIPDRDLRAYTWFRAYLAVAPNGDKSSEARDQINKLEIRIEATVQRLVNEGRQLASRVTDTSALSNIGPDQARAGDLNGAFDTINRISDDTSGVYRSSAYSSIAQFQAQTGDISGAESTVYKIGSNQTSYATSAKIEIARAQAKAGKKEDAKSTLRSARDLSINAYNRVSDKYSKTSAAQSCGYELGNIGSAQAEIGDLDGARQSLNAIPQNPYADSPRQSIRAAIDREVSRQEEKKIKDGQTKANPMAQLQESRRIALSMSDPNAKADALLSVISKDIQLKNFADAESLVEQIDDKEWRKGNAYSTVISALSNAGRTAEAHQVLGKALSRANRLNSLGFSYIISSALQLQDFNAAKQLINLLKPSERQSPMSDYMKAYAIARAKAGDFSAAKNAAQQVANDYSKGYMIQAIIDAELQKGDVAGASSAATELSASNSDRSQNVRRIVDFLVKKRQFRDAEKTAQDIPETKNRDDAYENISRYLSQVGEFADSERIAELITDVGQRAKLYCSFVSYLDSAGHRAKSLEVMKHADELSGKVTDAAIKAECYSNVASGWLSVGDAAQAEHALAQARRSATELTDPSKRYSALYSISYTEDRCSLPDDIEKSLYFERESTSQQKVNYQSSNYSYIAQHLARRGDIAAANEIASSISDESYRTSVAYSVGQAQVQNGNITAAEQTAKKFKDASNKDNIYYYIVLALIRHDDLKEAERVLSEMSGKGSYNDSSGVYLAIAYLKKNDVAAAKRCADKVDDPTQLMNSALFDSIASSGQTAWGKELIAKAEPKMTQSNASGWSSLGMAKAKVGDIDGAKRVLSSIVSDYDSYKANVCTALAEAGEIDFAKQFASQLKDRDYQISVFLACANAQAKKGDKQGAEATLAELMNKSPSVYQVTSAAALRYTYAGAAAAHETLARIHPADADLDPWVSYQIASATEEAGAAKKIADGIADPDWKSRAYTSVIYKEKDSPAKAAIAAAIPNAFYKSQAYQGLVTSEIDGGDLKKALQFANSVPTADLKLIALQTVLGAALVRENLAMAEEILKSLPESDSKACLAMEVARAAASLNKKDVLTRSVAIAQKSAGAMQDGFWKARTFDEIAAIATTAKETKLSQPPKKEALRLAAQLTGSEKQNWENYLAASLPSPEDATKQVEGEKRVDDYVSLMDYDLKNELYTDFASYMRGVQAKSQQSQVISGMLEAARNISEELKKIQAIGTPKPTTS